ncbi:hypothetical protein NIES2119_07055 [[Phormidium ambiguum] IAM M-71]|uniref:Circadian input-output histidine kinase CikA n=1 Tax=[Phormidium ambiguum] IAM M-71 TaxID=454136 RepID=A0A1U7IQ98_9CYAN|nr:PAS domain S-box protein [Phormidium ambiguum]OKH39481.1 hypothetical protein NIES2119_07055 [Phormidium ambiguum IAM M-71]
MSKKLPSRNLPVSSLKAIDHETLERLVAERTTALQEELSQKSSELQRYKERFEAFFAATSQLVWVADEAGNVYDTSSWKFFTGRTDEEAKGLGWLDAIHPDDRQRVAQHWKEAAAAQSLYHAEYRLLTKDGTYRYFVTQGVPVLNEDGSIREWVGTATDVNDRKIAEIALQQSEQRFRSLIEATAQVIWNANAEGELINEQSSWSKFTGQSLAEYQGEGWLNAVHPDDRQFLASKWAQAVRDRSFYEVEFRQRRHDGEYRYMNCRAIPILNPDRTIREWIGANTDITERQQTEAALRQKEAQYRSIFEAVNDGITIYELETGNIVAVNPAQAKMHGYSVEEFMQLAPGSYVHSDCYRLFKDFIRTVKSGKQFSCQAINLHKDGTLIDVEVIAVPYWQDGKLYALSVVRDISERKQAEIALQQSEQRFRSLIETTAQIIWNTNAEGELNPCQFGWSNFTGQTFSDYKKWGWLDAVHPDDREHTAKCWATAVANQTLYQVEHRLRRYDGEYCYMSVRAVPILAENGEIREWIGVHTDITERRQAEAALQQNEERFRSLIEATTDIIWNANAQGEQMLELTNWSKFTGQTNEERIGWGWLNAIHPEDHLHTTKIWLAAIANRTLYEVEYRLRRHDGEYRHMTVRGVPILDADGNISEWIGICADITERKEWEIAITKAKEAAETANRAKSEFLANMSHELRTPLNGIIGYAQILLRGRTLTEEDRSRIDVIYQCGSHLLTLINDILDLSKIEAGKVELIPSDFHFPAFLQGVAEMCRIRAELKGIQFHYQSTSELPIAIHADEKRLRQVLINLLTNAIKFTDKGIVNFTVSFATPGKIRFQVQDTGIGIAAEKLQTIFLPFEQVTDSKRQGEGTGLGLAISQEIVELMGSKIQVQSEMNVGSIFWFDVSFPEATEWIKTSQTDDKGQIIGIKDSQPKILVVDDKWENRSVISNLLGPIGFIVFEATSGQEGWQKIHEHKPNLIITDLLMPKGDGFELIKRIRQSETYKNLIIIVSSASVFESDQYRSIEAGGNDFMPKPVMAKELLEKLQKYLQIEWIYEEKAASPEHNLENPKLFPPPAEQLEIIYELAMKGNFKGIIKQAKLLEQTDQKYQAFAKKLNQLANGFQDKEIVVLVQSFK